MPRSEVRRLLAELPQSGMHRVPSRFFGDVRRRFEEEGWRVFVLPDGINDHPSFVRAATGLLPFNPPWYGREWNAFIDSLWEGLFDLPERRIAILWPDASTLASSDRKTYRRAVECLEDVSDDLAGGEPTEGNPKDLAVVVGT